MHTLPEAPLRLRAGPPGRGPELCHWKPLSWCYRHHRRGRVQSNISARHRSVLNSPSWQHQTAAGGFTLSGQRLAFRFMSETKKLAKHKQDPSMKWTDTKEDGLGCLLFLCTVSRCLCSCLLALAKSTKLIEPGTFEFSGNNVETGFRCCAGSLRAGYGRRWNSGARVAAE